MTALCQAGGRHRADGAPSRPQHIAGSFAHHLSVSFPCLPVTAETKISTAINTRYRTTANISFPVNRKTVHIAAQIVWTAGWSFIGISFVICVPQGQAVTSVANGLHRIVWGVDSGWVNGPSDRAQDHTLSCRLHNAKSPEHRAQGFRKTHLSASERTVVRRATRYCCGSVTNPILRTPARWAAAMAVATFS